MSSDDDLCGDESGESGDRRPDYRARWNRCVFGSVLSISSGILLGTVGTVVLASEVPVLVGTGIGVSMAAAYCGKTYRGGSAGPKNTGHLPTASDEGDEEEDVCRCFADEDEEEEEEAEENPTEQPCSLQAEVDGYQCTCTCLPTPHQEEEEADRSTC